MAIFHMPVTTISRSSGRSGTASAAYRAGDKIRDERTGGIFDYTKKGGVASSSIFLPDGAPEWGGDRSALWNAAEQAEKRKNSQVAREFVIALPAEISPSERQRLAYDFAKELVERHGCAADVSVHAPGRGGDIRNHHAHILLTTRRLGVEGFGEKTRELTATDTGPAIVTEWRQRWEVLHNERMKENGSDAFIDCRTLEAQGIDREPGVHLGPAATAYERDTGKKSYIRIHHEAAIAERQQEQDDQGNVDQGIEGDIEIDITERLQAAKIAGELERELDESNQRIIDLSGNLKAAIRERDRQAEQERYFLEEIIGVDSAEDDNTTVSAKVAAEQEQEKPKPKTQLQAGVDQWRQQEQEPEPEPETEDGKIVREYDEERKERSSKRDREFTVSATAERVDQDKDKTRRKANQGNEPEQLTGLRKWTKRSEYEGRYAAWLKVDQALEKRIRERAQKIDRLEKFGAGVREVIAEMEKENPGRTLEVAAARDREKERRTAEVLKNLKEQSAEKRKEQAAGKGKVPDRGIGD